MPNTTVFPSYVFDRCFHIPLIDAEASALTFSPFTNRLYTISDEPPFIVEFTTGGRKARRIELEGFDDTEGLAHLEGNLFAVAEERLCRISVIEILPDREKATVKARRRLNIPVKGNKGIEGVTYDAATDTLHVGREHPPTIFQVRPFLNRGRRCIEETGLDLSTLDDLSDIFFDPEGPWLWALSHESKRALIFDQTGKRVGKLPLKKGRRSLRKTVKQAEGIVRDARGRLFVCSEPNLVYRFRPE